MPTGRKRISYRCVAGNDKRLVRGIRTENALGLHSPVSAIGVRVVVVGCSSALQELRAVEWGRRYSISNSRVSAALGAMRSYVKFCAADHGGVRTRRGGTWAVQQMAVTARVE